MTPEYKSMEQLLAQLLIPDTTTIDKATETLQKLFTSGEAIPLLCNVLSTCHSMQLRQYAAVLLRKRLAKAKNWSKVSQSNKELIKSGIITLLVNEKEKVVKVAIVQFVAIVCKHELKKGTWPEFSNFIQNLITSKTLSDVELAMFTMSVLTDIAPTIVSNNPSSIVPIFHTVFHSLDDLTTILGYYTTKTLTHVAAICDRNPELREIYMKAFPKVMEAFPALCVKNEERACEVTDFFYEVVTGPKAVITPLFNPYIEFILRLAANKELGESVRNKMIALVGESVKAKKKLVLKNNLVKPIIEVLFTIMCEPLDGLDDDDDENWFNDEESEQPTHAASVMLGSMAICLPPMKLITLLTEHVLAHYNSEDLYVRKACYLALGCVTEGAAECIRSNFLKPFVSCVTTGITDSSAAVRNAALFALGQFAVHLQPEVSHYHYELMPILFKYLGHLRQRLVKGGPDPPGTHSMFYAIETYCENMKEKDLNPYLAMLFEYLLVILDKKHSHNVQEQAISAIGAISTASKRGILPFFPAIIEKLKVYLVPTPEESEIQVQALALETLGLIIRTMGAEHFGPMAPETMSLCLELLKNVDDPGTRAAVYAVFGALSTCLKEGSAIFFPTVIERIYKTLRSTEGFVRRERDELEPFCVFEDMTESETECDEAIATDSDMSADDENVEVENDYLAEKYEACAALKDFATHAEKSFRPYLFKSYEELILYYEVAESAENKSAWFDCIARIIVNMSKIKSASGKDLTRRSLCVFFPQCLLMASNDKQYTVVNSALESFAILISEIGPDSMVYPDLLENILALILSVLKKELPCQEDDDDEDDDLGEAEQDEVLVESACEIIPALSKSVSPEEFKGTMEKLFPTIIQKLVNKECSPSQRSFFVGTLAETIAPLETILPGNKDMCGVYYGLFLNGARDEFPDVRNNSIFGLGELIRYGKDHLYPLYMDILQVFSSTIAVETKQGVIDNICGALSKMIIGNYSILPLEEIFPVMLERLPLKEDFTENMNVIECFCHLYQLGHPVLKNEINRVIHNCCIIVLEKKSEEKIIWEAVKLLKTCLNDFPAEMNTVISAFPPESAEAISMALKM